MTIVSYRDRNRAGLDAAAGWERQRMVVDFGALGVEVDSGADGMTRAETVGGIDLDTVAPVAAEDVGCDTVVNQVADIVGIELDRRIAAEAGDLIGESR